MHPHFIDLHVHSDQSDGTLSPEEVVKRACDKQLSAIALTDHDTVQGVTRAKEAARLLPYPLEVISGVEISAAYKQRDIHILGLFVDETNKTFRTTLENAVANRDARNEKMAKRFRELGIPLTLEELRTQSPDTVITRAHFARYLIEHHYVKTNDEAFDRYLGYHAPCFIPREYMEPETAIALILSAGGIPVLAHPLLYKLPADELEALLLRLKNAGLVGLEVLYSANTNCDENILRSYANRYGFLMTGGSDFHGANKPQIEIGIGRGNLKIPESILDTLKQYLRERHIS